METMNKKNAQLLREILKDVLTEPLKNHGLKFELGNARFDNDSVKFNGFVISLEGGLSQEEKDLKQELEWRSEYPHLIELDSNRVAENQGKQYTLVGYKPRARKNPFIVREMQSMKDYVISEKNAERLFAVEKSKQELKKRLDDNYNTLQQTDMNGNYIKSSVEVV
jgi:hypothetical protein